MLTNCLVQFRSWAESRGYREVSQDPWSQRVLNVERETNVEISNYSRCGNPLTETWTTCHGGQRTERLPLFSNLLWVKNKKGAIGKNTCYGRRCHQTTSHTSDHRDTDSPAIRGQCSRCQENWHIKSQNKELKKQLLSGTGYVAGSCISAMSP